MSFPVIKARLRYVVPIVYEGNFDDMVQAIDNLKIEDSSTYKWQRLSANKFKDQSKLYPHINFETLFDEQEITNMVKDVKIGCQWIHYMSDDSDTNAGNGVVRFSYLKTGLTLKHNSLPKETPLKVNNLGLIIYRNNIGLIWYEILLDEKCGFNSDELITFQANMKKLNVNEYCNLWTNKRVLDKLIPYGISYKLNAGKNLVKDFYIQPFHFGKWLQEQFEDLKLEYVNKEKSSFSTTLKRSLANAKNIADVTIHNHIDQFPLEKKFVPSQAILFNYVLLKPQQEELSNSAMADVAYHLTNGYNANHHFNEINLNTMFFPFKEVVWFGTKEGMSFLVWPTQENLENFRSNGFDRAKGDYFTLFIKALYQSYSLMQYSNRIAKEVVVSKGNFLKSDIVNLFTEINIFLVKNIETSVSFIHHQSEFYLYLVKALRIEEDVKSVTAGLETLSILKREQQQQIFDAEEKHRDNKIQAGVGLFAVMGIASALVDGFDFIAKFNPEGDWDSLSDTLRNCELIFISIALIVCGIASWYAIKAFRSAFGDSKGDKNS